MLDWSPTQTDSFIELCSNMFEPCVCLWKYLNHCFNLNSDYDSIHFSIFFLHFLALLDFVMIIIMTIM